MQRFMPPGNALAKKLENRINIVALYITREISAASFGLQSDTLPGQRTASIR